MTFDPRSRRGARLHRSDTAAGLTAISCPSGAMCLATGTGGRVYYGRPGASRWAVTHLFGAAALTSACESTTVCVVSDEAGQAWTSH